MVAFSEKLMKKNIFLFLIAVFVLFISACGDDEEEIVAGSSCASEGSEICSDNGIELLLCQDSVWTLKKQCNISIGKRCRQNADGIFDCFSDSENDVEINNDDDIEYIHEDNETEKQDAENTSGDPDNTGHHDGDPATDSDGTDDSDDEFTDIDHDEDQDNDSDNDQDEDQDNDQDNDNTDSDDTDEDIIQPGQCASNSECQETAPYCSLSTSECIANAVFITEYIEGSGNNKALEIYNGSKSAVDLSNYTIKQANNGNNWGYTENYIYTFSAAQLAPGATLTICNINSGEQLEPKCNYFASGSTFNFNGDDGMALFEGNTIIDQIGNQDAVKWSVAGVENATAEHTLRRKTSVIQGTTDWAASAGTNTDDSQWIVLQQDIFDGLGTR